MLSPQLKLLASSCGLWLVYYGITTLKRREGEIGKYVYGSLIVPCLFTSIFLLFAIGNMVLDTILKTSSR